MTFLKQTAEVLSWHGVVFLVATAIVSWVGTAEMTPDHDLDSWLTYAPLLGPAVTGVWYGARSGIVKTEMTLPWRMVVQVAVPLLPVSIISGLATALALPPEDPAAWSPHYLWGSGDPFMFVTTTAIAIYGVGWIFGFMTIGAPFLAVRDPKALLTGRENPDKTASPAARLTAALVGACLLITMPASALVAVGMESLDVDVWDIDIPETFSKAFGVLTGSGDSGGWVALAAGMILLAVFAVLVLLGALARQRTKPDERGERLPHMLGL